MKDNYEHTDMDVIYITESIPGPPENSLEYEMLLGDYNSQMLDNCYCPRNCVKFFCKCLHISQGENYNKFKYDGNLNYSINHNTSIFTDYPMIECNSNCKCSASCGNRIVQNGPMEGLIVKACEDKKKGLGLFTTNFIVKGSFICEYAGELLIKTQAIQRSKENEAQGKMNYIFCLNEHTHDSGFIQTFVDPSKFGNIGRYINHSCEPNSWVMPVRSEIAIPRIAIFACSDIMPGEEITFSYSCTDDINVIVSETASKKKICLCKSKECKGHLPFENF